MNTEIFNYIVITCISGALSIMLGTFAYIKRKQFSSSKTFIWITFFSAIYIFGHAIELGSNSLSEIQFWIKFQYLGLPFIAPFGLLLILQYVGLEKYINKKSLFLIFIIPFSTFILSATNDFHQLLYRSVYLRPNEKTSLADMLPGPWYYVHGSYTFSCLFFGICILLWYWNKTKWVYWKQILTLLLGNLLPMIASFLYLVGLSPMGMDPVPVVMCVTSALYIWAILSSKLLALAPIARDRIFESMRDGVIVVDTHYRIVDYNASARKMISSLNSSNIGNCLSTVLFEPFHYLVSATTGRFVEKELNWSSEDKHFRIHLTPILKANSIPAGTTIVINDITDQKQLEEKLTHLAFTDGLTKLYNRIYFMEKSSEKIRLSYQENEPFSLLIFDIDYFKKINDTYGHSVGDKAICHVVSQCKKLLHSEHIFARFGGEEFIVSLPKLSLNKAGSLAERIRNIIEETPLQTEYGPIYITVSFGVAESTDNISLDKLIHRADQALYSAKKNGRNSVHLAETDSSMAPLKKLDTVLN